MVLAMFWKSRVLLQKFCSDQLFLILITYCFGQLIKKLLSTFQATHLPDIQSHGRTEMS